ncbi:MAG: hypothetical protein N3F63_02890 [Thermoplasmata archaeon]|nr:hypothetical protein [Thermoplasmata archaeon]
MKDVFDSPLIIGLSARNLLAILSGFLLLVSPLLLWTAFWNNGVEQKLDGFELQREANAFAIILLPLCGLAAILSGFVHSRFPDLRGNRVVLAFGLSTAILSMVALIATTVQAELWMGGTAGTSFLNNVMLGWYAALTGTFLLFFALLVPRQRKLFPESE